MQRSIRRSGESSGCLQRTGSASIDLVLILGVMLPLVAFVLPASRTAIQAAFSWFCRITTCPFI